MPKTSWTGPNLSSQKHAAVAAEAPPSAAVAPPASRDAAADPAIPASPPSSAMDDETAFRLRQEDDAEIAAALKRNAAENEREMARLTGQPLPHTASPAAGPAQTFVGSKPGRENEINARIRREREAAVAKRTNANKRWLTDGGLVRVASHLRAEPNQPLIDALKRFDQAMRPEKVRRMFQKTWRRVYRQATDPDFPVRHGMTDESRAKLDAYIRAGAYTDAVVLQIQHSSFDVHSSIAEVKKRLGMLLRPKSSSQAYAEALMAKQAADKAAFAAQPVPPPMVL